MADRIYLREPLRPIRGVSLHGLENSVSCILNRRVVMKLALIDENSTINLDGVNHAMFTVLPHHGVICLRESY
ncbi:MAG: hypothetical protein ACPG20_03265, partial [Pontimonas sp.]